jgi:hypothetical protein
LKNLLYKNVCHFHLLTEVEEQLAGHGLDRSGQRLIVNVLAGKLHRPKSEKNLFNYQIAFHQRLLCQHGKKSVAKKTMLVYLARSAKGRFCRT